MSSSTHVTPALDQCVSGINELSVFFFEMMVSRARDGLEVNHGRSTRMYGTHTLGPVADEVEMAEFGDILVRHSVGARQDDVTGGRLSPHGATFVHMMYCFSVIPQALRCAIRMFRASHYNHIVVPELMINRRPGDADL